MIYVMFIPDGALSSAHLLPKKKEVGLGLIPSPYVILRL